ncbi:MAG: hypothetical protein FWE12_00230 [Oscillospiraceae bacterium]|nr:hypothetical protein [Oscillospiraceae bacterium]
MENIKDETIQEDDILECECQDDACCCLEGEVEEETAIEINLLPILLGIAGILIVRHLWKKRREGRA